MKELIDEIVQEIKKLKEEIIQLQEKENKLMLEIINEDEE